MASYPPFYSPTPRTRTWNHGDTLPPYANYTTKVRNITLLIQAFINFKREACHSRYLFECWWQLQSNEAAEVWVVFEMFFNESVLLLNVMTLPLIQWTKYWLWLLSVWSPCKFWWFSDRVWLIWCMKYLVWSPSGVWQFSCTQWLHQKLESDHFLTNDRNQTRVDFWLAQSNHNIWATSWPRESFHRIPRILKGFLTKPPGRVPSWFWVLQSFSILPDAFQSQAPGTVFWRISMS